MSGAGSRKAEGLLGPGVPRPQDACSGVIYAVEQYMVGCFRCYNISTGYLVDRDISSLAKYPSG